ncbi:hypothetical protein Tco_0178718 [Tanacetum coccineum]
MYTINSSFGLGATGMGSPEQFLNSGKDFFADLERNLFKLANFPLRLWTSLIVHGDGSRITASILSGILIGQPVVIINFSHDPCLYQFLYLYLDDSARSGAYPFSLLREADILPELSRCSTMIVVLPHVRKRFHANISKFSLRSEHTSLRISLDAVVHRGPRMQSGTFSKVSFISNIKASLKTPDSDYPPTTRNFSISCAVDVNCLISLIPSLPMIPLYGDNDLTIMKLIHAFVECSASPIITKSLSCPSGHIVYPLKLVNDVVAGTIWLLISGRSRLKQCSKVLR